MQLSERLTAALADRYEVQREIGEGGMARVYLARDLRHDRRVAVKVLLPELQTGVNPERFLAEIRTAANLHHPHILPLYDSGEADGLLFYTMPFVEGITVQERLQREGPLSLEDALRIVSEVGDGLAHAHRQGLVHRDVKPSNILLSSGHAQLGDFGLARAVDSGRALGLTQTGMSVGTPLYMSPEQAAGDGEVDARSDVYSLGCVLYEMLTGEPPYNRSSPFALIAAHAMDDVPSASAVRTDVPGHVDQSITRAMAKHPDERFSSVEEFIKGLDGGAVSVPRPARAQRRHTASSRASRWVWVVGTALSTGVVIAVVASSGDVESPPSASVLVPDRVVVAPLENRTGDPSLDEIGRMAADWITEGLHRTRIVDVVPSLTALQAVAFVQSLSTRADTVVDPIATIAFETGAGKVISGAYYLDGDSLLYQMQVTDAVAGRLIHALDPVRGSPSSPGTAVSELRNYVMGSLAVNLDERLVNVETESVQPPSYESYHEFDAGMQRYLDSDWRAAADLFRRAFDLDTTFVLSLHYLTLSEANIGARGGGPVMDSLTAVLAGRRTELADYHQHWLDYLAARVRGRNVDALNAIRRAAQLAPGSKAVYNYAYAAQLTHRPREAVEALRSLDPERGPMRGWFPYWTLLTDNLHRLGRHDEELVAAQRARQLHPERGWSFIQEGHALAALGRIDELRALMQGISGMELPDIEHGDVWNSVAEELRFHGHLDAARDFNEASLAWLGTLAPAAQADPSRRLIRATALQGLGRFQEAFDVVTGVARENSDDLALLGWVGVLSASTGDTSGAQRILERLREEDRNDPYSRGFYLLQAARIAGALGQGDLAAELLGGSVAEGFRPLRHPDINFEPVRNHPSLQEVLTPVGD